MVGMCRWRNDPWSLSAVTFLWPARAGPFPLSSWTPTGTGYRYLINRNFKMVVMESVLRSRSIFDRLRVFFWPAPAPALVKKYALKKLKKMNNSTSCSRKNTFLRISFLFVHVRMQEQNRVQSVWNKNTVNFKKVKLYLQYQYLQVVSSVNFWGTFLKFNFSSMVEPEPEPVLRTGSGSSQKVPAPQHWVYKCS